MKEKSIKMYIYLKRIQLLIFTIGLAIQPSYSSMNEEEKSKEIQRNTAANFEETAREIFHDTSNMIKDNVNTCFDLAQRLVEISEVNSRANGNSNSQFLMRTGFDTPFNVQYEEEKKIKKIKGTAMNILQEEMALKIKNLGDENPEILAEYLKIKNELAKKH